MSWGARKQETVALSTMEVKCVAACSAAQEATWLCRLFHDLINCEKSILLHTDNNSALMFIKNSKHHRRIKHIDIKYHFVRLKTMDGPIKLMKIDGSN